MVPFVLVGSYLAWSVAVLRGRKTPMYDQLPVPHPGWQAVLFIVALFAAPLIGAVPAAATAPALVVVGGLMLSSIGEIPWDDVVELGLVA